MSVQKRTRQAERWRELRLVLFVFFAAGLLGFLMGFLGSPKGFGSVLQGLPGMFVAGQVIFFAVMYGCRAVSMRRHFVKLSGSLVGIPWHNISFQKKSVAGGRRARTLRFYSR